MAETLSRREQLINTLVDELLAIKSADGYRTDPKAVVKTDLGPQEIQNFPTIMVWVGPEEWMIDDQIKTVFSSNLRITIVGYYQADLETAGGYDVSAGEAEGEALMVDLKKVIGSFMLKYVNTTANRWQVLGSPTIRWDGPIYSKDVRKGFVQCQMTIRLMYQNTSF